MEFSEFREIRADLVEEKGSVVIRVPRSEEGKGCAEVLE